MESGVLRGLESIPQRGSAELSGGSATSCGGQTPLTPVKYSPVVLVFRTNYTSFTVSVGEKFRDFVELYNVTEHMRTNCLGYIGLQAHNSTAAIVSFCCTLLQCTACKKLLSWRNCGLINQILYDARSMVRCSLTTHYGRLSTA